MSTYKELFGKPVKHLSPDPTDAEAEGQIWYNTTSGTFKTLLPVAAWSSSASMNTARPQVSGLGSQTAGVAVGGSPQITASEEYNGSGWTTSGNLNEGRADCNTFGTQTAGMAAGGDDHPTPPRGTVNSESYDGSSWTEGPNLVNGSYEGGGGAACGSSTSGLIVGGRTGDPASLTDATQEYDGSSWTAGTVYPAVIQGSQVFGATLTAAVAAGGALYPDVYQTASFAYDGTNWTAAGALNSGRSAGVGAGTATAGLVFGGVKAAPDPRTQTETYDGTTFAVSSVMASPRVGFAGSKASGVAAFASGPGPTGTEEFNISTSTFTAGAWASGGALTNARRSPAQGIGPATAAMAVGGIHVTTALAYNEQYDGTSWTEGAGALNTARSNLGGSTAGSQTAALVFGGSTTGTGPGETNTTESYDGSTWTTTPNSMNTARNSLGGAGTSTAALGFGGVVHPTDQRGDTEEWNGTSWTEGPDMIQGRISMGTCGTQTAALGCSGYVDGGPTAGNKDLTEEYNGLSWTAGGANLLVNSGSGAAGTTTDALSFGGLGDTNVTTGYDGTTWSTRPALGTGRDYVGMAGTAIAALCIAGNAPGDAGTTTVEAFTGETSALSAAETLTTS